VLRCAALCCAVLRCAALCCAVLRCAVQHWKLRPDHLEEFVNLWAEYDDGSGTIDPRDLEGMLLRCVWHARHAVSPGKDYCACSPAAFRAPPSQVQLRLRVAALCVCARTQCRLSPPLGLGASASSTDVLRFVFDLDIPLLNGRVPFHRTAYELVRRCSGAEIPQGILKDQVRQELGRHACGCRHAGGLRFDCHGSAPSALHVCPHPTPAQIDRLVSRAFKNLKADEVLNFSVAVTVMRVQRKWRARMRAAKLKRKREVRAGSRGGSRCGVSVSAASAARAHTQHTHPPVHAPRCRVCCSSARTAALHRCMLTWWRSGIPSCGQRCSVGRRVG
jgi:hypothetical protein